MAITFSTQYPANVKNSYWQGKKKFKEKVKSDTKTGLGDLLKDAEAKWKLIPFKKLDAAQLNAPNYPKALSNLKEAETIKKTQVKAARDAITLAMNHAKATARNPALSNSTQTEATGLANRLSTLQGYLTGLPLDDLKQAAVNLKAAATGGTALRNITLRYKAGHVADSPEGTLWASGKVTIRKLTWTNQIAVPDPSYLEDETVTIDATRPDNSLYRNDLKLTELSDDHRIAKFG
jgi:hypothetical protein